MCYVVLHCTALRSAVLNYVVLYCTVLHCTLLHCTVLYCTVLQVLLAKSAEALTEVCEREGQSIGTILGQHVDSLLAAETNT